MEFGKVCDSLSRVLADTYVLMLKTQSVHWNVVGGDFWDVHLLSETQYGELFDAVDELAERIRALGGVAPGTMKEFLTLSRISEGGGDASVSACVAALAEANAQMATLLRKEIRLVGDLGEVGTEDTYVARLKAHEKASWMWKAMGGKSQPSTGAAAESRPSQESAKKVSQAPASKSSKKSAPEKSKKDKAAKSASPVIDKTAKATKVTKKSGRLSRNVGQTG